MIGEELVPEALDYFQHVTQISDRDSCTDIFKFSVSVHLSMRLNKTPT